MSDNKDAVTDSAGWPFEEDRRLRVIVPNRVMSGSSPILEVIHDDDGEWQFLDGEDVSVDDAGVYALEEVFALDPSTASLNDLPRGWRASRSVGGGSWQNRRPM